MQNLRKGDFLFTAGVLLILAFLCIPATHALFMDFTATHAYLGGFSKFLILATMGELLAIRVSSGDWSKPPGLIFRAFVWGFLGMVIVLVFAVFGAGIEAAMATGLLPGKRSGFAYAFFVSATMNLTFAPAMMAFHRITDTYIDMRYEKKGRHVRFTEVVARIDWKGFYSFVIAKTIPLFWIPAHTITFLLPAEYRVLAAAFLSMALGAILAYAKKRVPGKKASPDKMSPS